MGSSIVLKAQAAAEPGCRCVCCRESCYALTLKAPLVRLISFQVKAGLLLCFTITSVLLEEGIGEPRWAQQAMSDQLTLNTAWFYTSTWQTHCIALQSVAGHKCNRMGAYRKGKGCQIQQSPLTLLALLPAFDQPPLGVLHCTAGHGCHSSCRGVWCAEGSGQAGTQPDAAAYCGAWGGQCWHGGQHHDGPRHGQTCKIPTLTTMTIILFTMLSTYFHIVTSVRTTTNGNHGSCCYHSLQSA